ncbi:hypothetical protein VB620_06895 [Nodularia harveyana UHCC-0300]|uniref:Uncharacterized protein n=1 Tax=Nodularia harveyana UHCC-0300 TaxID=2974287 RepID=A0ABU5UC03_9CYAN|nr:hypothetical protein [Nodularia harveyana]MEA5581066.1 hypothetical protein [Nodularia harveyana UHCC-0300]
MVIVFLLTVRNKTYSTLLELVQSIEAQKSPRYLAIALPNPEILCTKPY